MVGKTRLLLSNDQVSIKINILLQFFCLWFITVNNNRHYPNIDQKEQYSSQPNEEECWLSFKLQVVCKQQPKTLKMKIKPYNLAYWYLYYFQTFQHFHLTTFSKGRKIICTFSDIFLCTNFYWCCMVVQSFVISSLFYFMFHWCCFCLPVSGFCFYLNSVTEK